MDDLQMKTFLALMIVVILTVRPAAGPQTG